MKIENAKLGMFDTFTMGYGNVVGSGIFVLLGLAIQAAGRAVPLAAVFGTIFMLMAFGYNIIISSMFVVKGGDYAQRAMVMPPVFKGLSACFAVFSGIGLTTFGKGIVQYASFVFPSIATHENLIAFIIISVFLVVSIFGSKVISKVNSVMGVVLLIAIAVYIVAGLPKVQSGYFGGEGFFMDEPFMMNGFGGVMSAVALLGWACMGCASPAVSMAAVIKNPKKTIPVAALLIGGAVIITYGLMGIVAAGILPYDECAGQSLAVTAKQIFSYPVFVVFVLCGACFALSTSLVAALAMIRYQILQVAEDGWLPEVFKKTTKDGYPWVSYLVYYLFGIMPLVLGFDISSVIGVYMTPLMLMCAWSNIGCIGLAKKYPEQWKRSSIYMPMPLLTVVCVLCAVCALTVLYLLTVDYGATEWITVIVLTGGSLLWSYYRLKSGKVDIGKLEKEKEEIIAEALQGE